MSKSKRRGKDLEDAGDSNTGLFNMDPNTPYRTHMLFPGRKEDDCGGPDPRRSSGSPGFVKAMMGWGSKRPSQTGGGAPNSQEMARYNRGTPTRPPEGGAAAPGAPGAPPRGRGPRAPMTREEAQRLREEELAGQAHGKDCFIIPQANLDRFLPDGVTLPRDPRKANNLITPALANPLVNSLDVHFDLSKTLLSRAQSLHAGEGYIFKNLEKDADYPYINYYVINKSREEAGQFYTDNKAVSHDELNASKLGYHVCLH